MPAKILIVDDELSLEKLIRLHFRKKLRAKEFEFLFAHNGIEALEILQAEQQSGQRVDLVLTDINMPEMDGLTLLAKLPEIDPTLKAVVVTAYGDMVNIRTAMNQGAFDFLIKPIDFKDVEITISRTLEHVYESRQNLQQLQQAQSQLVQTEKMSALGELVSGVAHEINNPLACIAGNLDFVDEFLPNLFKLLNLYHQKFPDPGAEIQQEIEEIELEYLISELPGLLSSMRDGANRISVLSKSLRIFSRSDNYRKVICDIHDGINSTLLLLKHRLIGNRESPPIQVVQEYGNLPPVECYPGQLNQVVMNLLANAIDALNDPDRDVISDDRKSEPKTIAIRTEMLQANETVAIAIKDNGPGIPETVREKIFEHLFTTKPVGKGTGLGLSIARQIVEENHGGQLRCISSPDQGAEFIITLPIGSQDIED